MARILKNSRINPRKLHPADAYNRAQIRKDTLDKALEEPQAGPVPDRGAVIRREGRQS